MLSGNSESQRQERISKLQVEIKEFEVAEKCAAKNLENLEEEAKDEILVSLIMLNFFRYWTFFRNTISNEHVTWQMFSANSLNIR